LLGFVLRKIVRDKRVISTIKMGILTNLQILIGLQRSLYKHEFRGDCMRNIAFVVIPFLAFAFNCCANKQYKKGHKDPKGEKINMKLSSPSFENGTLLNKKFTCDGENVSPDLRWEDVPTGVKSFVLMCDDPDAPRKTWVHWLVFNLPATMTSLEENASVRLFGAKEGMTDFGKIGYGGACPPPGHGPHRYFFKLYALDTTLDLPEGVSNGELIAAMNGHILAHAQLMGTYERS
jgi:Raf kinase inhibitor-like YbhB/YbcL family protein